MTTYQHFEAWLASTVTMVHEQGYRVTPVYETGTTQAFGAGQTYSDTSNACWSNAVAIGVVLDNAILVDWDGNKASEAGDDIISLVDLAAHFDLPHMPPPAQENSAGDSLHFLFSLPSGVDAIGYKQSCDSYLPYVDLKRGNQLMHLKPHKVITNGALQRSTDLPEAPPKLVEAFSRGKCSTRATGYEAPLWSGARWEVDEAHAILRYIEPTEDYQPWLDVLMRIHDKFGATEEALEIADAWSSHAGNYGDPNEVSYKLESLASGGGIKQLKKSWGALCIRARDNGADLGAIRELYRELGGDPE